MVEERVETEPEPVPGSNPLIVETVRVEIVIELPSRVLKELTVRVLVQTGPTLELTT
jgi:hypothetical protein